MAKSKITQNVNKDKFFNDLPFVNPESSKWSSKHSNYQSCNLGQIVPIYYDEVLPDEKRKITMGMISHTTTPIAPIFNAMYTEIRAFFVPHRLSADLLNGYKDRKSPWVKVFGEDNKSSDSTIIVPLDQQKLPDLQEDFIDAVKNYLSDRDFDDNIFNSLDITSPNDDVDDVTDYNFLNLAAYELIYQRHYRNENYESATESDLYRFLFNAYNDSDGSSLGLSFTFEIANREKDYFTGAKPFTQKGDPIEVNIGGTVDVKYKNTTSTTQIPSTLDLQPENGVEAGKTQTLVAKSNNLTIGKAVVDLSSASGISVEELRLLIKTQELLEKDAMYGTRYCESLNAHFGTCPLDLTLQDPQELYRTTITSNMQAIFQTSSTNGEASILGTIGANSTTQTDPFVILPETEFKEHGLLMICAVHKLQNVYDVNFFRPKFNFKKERFDFYTPELNDLGFQPLEKNEMPNFFSRGFNEAFAEYRFKFNKLHGSLAGDFSYWAPSISGEYISVASMYKESSDILDKALSVRSETAPQFYDAWGFIEENTKPMSLHSIPGMDGVI